MAHPEQKRDAAINAVPKNATGSGSALDRQQKFSAYQQRLKAAVDAAQPDQASRPAVTGMEESEITPGRA